MVTKNLFFYLPSIMLFARVMLLIGYFKRFREPGIMNGSF
jgi:hypothetical protein